jgi:glycosyltransferase involved in cell wall biosynthesis
VIKDLKIAILLPYKENYSEKTAGAVSLFVSDTLKKSFYYDSAIVCGNTNSFKKLTLKYKNIPIKKSLIQSTSFNYVQNFLNLKNILKSDLIEIHNRPKYINQIREKFLNKVFLYFHNDPLSMNGSKTVVERINLLNTVDKIIFNSRWTRTRFFIGIKDEKNFLKQTFICYQSSSKVKINFKKKEKIISFVGKLNKAKGYDIFGKAIIRILDKYPSWIAKVYGDEPREKLSFNHKNLLLLGFQENNTILRDLKKISISVICSRWEEPFGRTSLEAASRGSAVLITNKGGLPETSSEAIILKDLSSNTLFRTINDLIVDKSKLLSVQKKNYKNFKFTHSFISKAVDKERSNSFYFDSPNLFNINKKNPLKIIHITNFNRKFNGRLHYNTSKRLNNGFVRLGHNVLEISDRDVIHENRKILDISGKVSLQNSIIENFNNFKPDCIIMGHADSIKTETLEIIKQKDKNLKICQWFLDPLGSRGPDYQKNNKRIHSKSKFMDATFLTSSPSVLSKDIVNSHFIPNPSDPSFETLKNYNRDCKNDLFFALSHGVHRGKLKKGKIDNREHFLNKLVYKNKYINFDLYGVNGNEPIWGNKFIEVLSQSSMGLNLSRGKAVKYYSSDRIAQLMGNGLLTFIDKNTFYGDFFTNKEIITYNDINDLSYKLNKYKKDVRERKIIAKNGRNKYIKFFNSKVISEFIIDKTFGFTNKKKFLWEK